MLQKKQQNDKLKEYIAVYGCTDIIKKITKESIMSGRRIDDHEFWAGKGSKESPFPMGSKMKAIEPVEGAGHVGMTYPDTQEAIRRDQLSGDQKIKSHKMKEGYRQ